MDSGLHMMPMKVLRNNPGIKFNQGLMTLSPQCECVDIRDFGISFLL